MILDESREQRARGGEARWLARRQDDFVPADGDASVAEVGAVDADGCLCVFRGVQEAEPWLTKGGGQWCDRMDFAIKRTKRTQTYIYRERRTRAHAHTETHTHAHTHLPLHTHA